jgi:sulfur carrier protein
MHSPASRVADAQWISIFVNGEARRFARPLTCSDLIVALGLAGKRVALECNGEIVPRGRHAEQRLAGGDKIEIVVAVGGG